MSKIIEEFHNFKRCSLIEKLFAIYIFLIPLQYGLNSNVIFLNKIRLTEIIFIFIILVLFINKKNYLFNNLNKLEFFLPSLLIFSCLVSLLNLNTFNYNFLFGTITFIYLFSLYLILCLTVRSAVISLFINSFIISSLIFSILGIFGLIMFNFYNIETSLIEIRDDFPYFDYVARIQSVTKHPNYFTNILVIPILFLVSQIFNEKKYIYSRIIILFILLTALFFTFSKDILLIIFSIFLIFLYSKYNKINNLVKLVTFLIMVLLILLHNIVTNFYFSYDPLLNDETIYFAKEYCCAINFFETKLYIYPTNYLFNKLAALKLFASSNYIGVGIENYKYQITNIDVSFYNSFWSWSSLVFDPHSTYFGTLAEIGLIGFISIIIILFFFLIIIFQLTKSNINSFKNIALISIIIYYILVSINIDILNFRHLWIIFAIVILSRRLNIREPGL